MAAAIYTCRVQGFSNAGALGTATGMVGQANLVQVELWNDNTIRFTDPLGNKYNIDLSTSREIGKFFKMILTGAAGVPTSRVWTD